MGHRHLLCLYNRWWESRLVPSQWRNSILISVHRDRDTTDPGTYKDLTLLPVTDKLFCLVVADTLMTTTALHDHQLGFHHERGTLGALFSFISTVQRRTRLGLPTYEALLDAKRAVRELGTSCCPPA